MARPKSDDKRDAIMAAAVRVIATQGLSAPTATIAREAGVSNGSLFTYFPTKAELFNQLYLELKAEMAAEALKGLPTEGGVREQMFNMWTHSLRWATSCPGKRRTLAQLALSDDITAQTLQTGHETMAGVAKLLERSRENGPLRDSPLGFVIALMNSVTDATIDFAIRDPANAAKHGKAAFDALWRMLA